MLARRRHNGFASTMPAAASTTTMPAATATAAAAATVRKVAEMHGSVVAYVIGVTRSVVAEILVVKSVAGMAALAVMIHKMLKMLMLMLIVVMVVAAVMMPVMPALMAAPARAHNKLEVYDIPARAVPAVVVPAVILAFPREFLIGRRHRSRLAGKFDLQPEPAILRWNEPPQLASAAIVGRTPRLA